MASADNTQPVVRYKIPTTVIQDENGNTDTVYNTRIANNQSPTTLDSVFSLYGAKITNHTSSIWCVAINMEEKTKMLLVTIHRVQNDAKDFQVHEQGQGDGSQQQQQQGDGENKDDCCNGLMVCKIHPSESTKFTQSDRLSGASVVNIDRSSVHYRAKGNDSDFAYCVELWDTVSESCAVIDDSTNV